MEKFKLRLLIAPIHYIIDEDEGSEYTRAYSYVEYLSKQKNIICDVLVGYAKTEKMNNFRLIRLWKNKPAYISNFMRLIFIFWIFFTSLKLLRQKKYDIIWHNGPFRVGKTFSLLALYNRKKIPFLLGPIPTPLHTPMGQGEFITMGKKFETNGSLFLKMLKKFDNKISFLGKIFSYLSDATLKNVSVILTYDTQGLKIIKSRLDKNLNKVFNFLIPSNFKILSKKKAFKSYSKFTLLTVSYLIQRKKTDDLLRALKILLKRGFKNIELHIVGEGPQKKTLMMLRDKLKIAPWVFFKGYIPRSQIHNEYFKADIFLSGSISDTMPDMYFEAMASQLPLVIVRNESSEDLQKAGIGAIFVDPNKPKEIANAVEKLITNEKKITDYGRTNYYLMKNVFNFTKRMKKLIFLMESLAKAN